MAWKRSLYHPSSLFSFFNGTPHGYACAVSSGTLVLSCVVVPFRSPEGEKGDQEKHLTGPQILVKTGKTELNNYIKLQKLGVSVTLECQPTVVASLMNIVMVITGKASVVFFSCYQILQGSCFYFVHLAQHQNPLNGQIAARVRLPCHNHQNVRERVRCFSSPKNIRCRLISCQNFTFR